MSDGDWNETRDFLETLAACRLYNPGAEFRLGLKGGFMYLIASMDQELFNWISNAADEQKRAGSFVFHFANAALHADSENYVAMRPTIKRIAAKYPEYAGK